MNRRLIEAAAAALLMLPLTAVSQDEAAAPASAPAAAAASADTGTVVFFREKKMMGAAIRYKVREDGVELCKLGSGTYCTVQAPAGKHSYTVHSEAEDVLDLEVEPGETYYVIGAISMGAFAGRPNLSPSSKEAFDGMKAKLKDNTGKDLDPPETKKKK